MQSALQSQAGHSQPWSPGGISSVRNGGSKQNWWNPRSQAPSQRIISLSADNSLDPHLAQNISSLSIRPSESNNESGNLPSEDTVSRCRKRSLIFNFERFISAFAR
uniref:Uncharacterized protein n=1 Tax=Opuntia streptacantha TaxID=393608 RepID=A0A7C9A952_OPUST